MTGPDAEKLSEIPGEFRNRVFFTDEDKLLSGGLRREDRSRKLFVSIDLDVLSDESFTSVWDQGNMKLETLQEIVERIKKEENVCAIDICG